MTSEEYIREHLETVQKVAAELLGKQSDKIKLIVNALYDAWERDIKVFTFGNGGSQANASHLAADLVKTVIDNPVKKHGIRAVCLGDNPSLMSALINDSGWADVYKAQLKTFAKPGDIVIAMSVHGGSGSDKAGAWSQNILRGLQYARYVGCFTIGLSGFDGGPMKDLVNVSVVVPAESTPLVESFHYLLNHLVVFRVKEMIEEETR